MSIFDRYRDIVDDWAAFEDALARPLPTCIVVNELKITPDALAQRLRLRGADPRVLPWTERAFVLPDRANLGTRLEYLAGLYNVQEEAAVLPVELLQAEPGERILDLCAAPGNKTAQVAMSLRNTGTVVGNDRSVGRLRAVRGVLDRLGIWNVCLSARDGGNYPKAAGTFDRVIVDVPCSCDGTSRKNSKVLETLCDYEYRQLGGVQRSLLSRALHLCRPGGRVVYSTCSYAPEENELVVHDVLRELRFEVEIESPTVPGFQTAQGLTDWNGEALDPRLSRTLRVWPHLNDTGGFYVAVLRKDDDAPDPQAAPPTLREVGGVEDAEWRPAILDRFGIDPAVMADLTVFRRNKKTLWVANGDLRPVGAELGECGTGLPLLRTQMAVPKLTTAGAAALGAHATRNVADVTADNADRYFRRWESQLSPEESSKCDSTGYVLVRCDGLITGVARYEEPTRTLKSHFPKSSSLTAENTAFGSEP